MFTGDSNQCDWHGDLPDWPFCPRGQQGPARVFQLQQKPEEGQEDVQHEERKKPNQQIYAGKRSFINRQTSVKTR